MDLSGMLKGFLSGFVSDVRQCIAVVQISVKLVFRRWVTTAFTMVIPIVALTFISFVQIAYGIFLIPKVDEILQRNDVGKEGEIVPPILTLPEIQYVYGTLETYFPNEIFYVANMSNFDAHLKNYPKYNLTIDKRQERGMLFEEFETSRDAESEYYNRLWDQEHLESDVANIFRVLGNVVYQEYTEKVLRYTLQFEGELDRKKHTQTMRTVVNNLNNNFSSSTQFCEKIGQYTGLYDCRAFLLHYFINLVDSVYIRERTGRVVQSKLAHIPYRSDGYEMENIVGEAQVAAFFGMILILTIPYLVYTLVLEKENKSRELMSLQGLKYRNYVFSTFFVFCSFHFVYCAVFWLFGRYGFKYRVFTHVSFLLQLIVGGGIILSSTSFVFLFAAFFRNAFIAMLCGFFEVLIFPMLLNSVLHSLSETNPMRLGLLAMFPYPGVFCLDQLTKPVVEDSVYIDNNLLFENIDFFIAVCVMYLSSIVHLVMYVYFENVIQQPFGVRKHPLYFLFDYIGFKKKKKQNIGHGNVEQLDSDVQEERNRIQQEFQGSGSVANYGVVVMGLTKAYGKKVVVKDNFFRIKKNECFGLLGQNGAGKSTTIKMLTGSTSSTLGKAYVCGHDISQNMEKIRKTIGICPQFSVIWAELTIREHIYFYCSLRGIPFLKQKEHVEKILREAELDREDGHSGKKFNYFGLFDKKVGHCSEGVQRRLAIAIALVGNPEVVFLDEPTTGLSPESKKCIWEIILRMKKTKCIVLTTHSMQEADILSDRIGIMAKGTFLCMGTSLHLKEKFGSGYTLKCRYDNPVERENLMRMVQNVVPSESKVVRDFAPHLTWEVHSSPELRISEIFKVFEKNRHRYSISEWSINQVTLEEVFLSLVKEDFIVFEEIVEENKRLKDDNRRLKHENNFLKTGKPLSTISEESGKIDDPLEQPSSVTNISSDQPSSLLPGGNPKIESNFFYTFLSQTVAALKKEFIFVIRNPVFFFVTVFSNFAFVLMLFMIWFLGRKDDDPVIFQPSYNPFVDQFTKCKTHVSDEDCFQFVYTANGNKFALLVMDNIIDNLGYEEDQHFKEFEDTETMIDFMKSNINITNFGVAFSSLESIHQGFVNYTEYVLYVNTTSITFPSGDLVSEIESMQLMIDRTILKIETNSESSIDVRTRDIPLVPIEEEKRPSKDDALFNSGLITMSLGPFPVFIYIMVYLIGERETNITVFLKTMGMKKIPMVIGYSIHFLVILILCSIVCYGTSYLCGFPNFQNLLPLLVFFMYYLTLMIQLNFFGRFVKSSREMLSFLVLYAVATFFMISVFESDLIQSIYSYTFDDVQFIWFLFYVFLPIVFPPIPLAKIYSDILLKSVDTFDYTTKTFDESDGFKFVDLLKMQKDDVMEFETLPTIIFLAGYFLSGIAFYIILDIVFSYIQKRRYFSKNTNAASPQGDLGIQLVGVAKKYEIFSKDPVLKNVDLDVPKNGCFVLLGPESSGKTTMLNLINGIHRISDGDVFINGFNVKTDFAETSKQVSFLPQLNILIEHMTCQEILSLFAGIRGIKRGIVDREINDILKRMNLTGNKNDKISTFSGGMKRRIALAVAMIGDPNVYLLDGFASFLLILFLESTTGLDPMSKNLVWKSIIETKENNTVMLTTHEMDEAESLGDKIGILYQGEIQCSGSAVTLKKEFGGAGYNLSFIAVRGREVELKTFLVKNLVSGKIVSSHNNFFVVNISNKAISELISLIQTIENLGEESFLSNWGVSQTDLYDVYKSVVFGNVPQMHSHAISFSQEIELEEFKTDEEIEIKEKQFDVIESSMSERSDEATYETPKKKYVKKYKKLLESDDENVSHSKGKSVKEKKKLKLMKRKETVASSETTSEESDEDESDEESQSESGEDDSSDFSSSAEESSQSSEGGTTSEEEEVVEKSVKKSRKSGGKKHRRKKGK